MSKREPPKPEPEIVRVYPEFSPQFREDLLWWARKNPQLWERLWDLIEAVLKDAYAGIGKPERLRYMGPNLWSRRINQEHRLVYRVEQNRILFLQARYHYEE